jgi:hypothetical protein
MTKRRTKILLQPNTGTNQKDLIKLKIILTF